MGSWHWVSAAAKAPRVTEDSFLHLCFSFGYSWWVRQTSLDAHKTYIPLPTTNQELKKKKTSIKQKAHAYMLIMCIKQIYIMVTSKPLYICQNVLEQYVYWIFPCRTKSPTVLVDRGGKGFPPQDTPHYILFLGYCLSITKASSKMTNGRRGEAERRQKTGAEKQEPSSTGPAQKDFPHDC